MCRVKEAGRLVRQLLSPESQLKKMRGDVTSESGEKVIKFCVEDKANRIWWWIQCGVREWEELRIIPRFLAWARYGVGLIW